MSKGFKPVELEYTEIDGILYPNIQISNDIKYDEEPLGKYGRMRLRYLKEHKTDLYRLMRMEGKLLEHCHRINKDATKRAILIEEQYLKKNPIPVDCGFMDRVGYHNIARDVAEEVVLREIVYR